MRLFINFIVGIFFLAIATESFANCGSQNDTIYICQGESVQLQTSLDFDTYLWTPNQNISNPNIYNPIVSPTQTTTYYVEVTPPVDFNVVVNGDFEQGNFGFQSDYIFTANGTFEQGHYGIFTNPTQFNSGFGNCSDHSPNGSGLMLVVDGATVLNENIWCQTINVYEERTYDFSSWITTVHPTEPAILQFSINGELLGNPLEINQNVCDWVEFTAEWYSACEATATICITNQSTVAFGNDFAIDDISFTFSNTSYMDTFLVVVLENSLTTIDTIACENGEFFFAGEEVPAGTQRDFVYTAFNGCDSVISVNVGLVDTFYFETLTDTLCPGDTVFYQGGIITRDTSICDVYATVLGCDSTFCFVVYFLSESTIDIIENNPSCATANDGSLFADPFAGLPPYQYLWNTGATTPLIENLTAGTFFLTVTDSRNCAAEKIVVFEAPPPLSVDYTIVEPNCNGFNTATIDIFPQGGVPGYLLSWNGENTSATFFDSLAAGTYTLSLEDSEGCRWDTLVTIEEPNALTISLGKDTSIVLGSSVVLDATVLSDFPYTFVWLPFVGLDCTDCENPTATPSDSRPYQFLVEDSQGCMAIDSIYVEVLKNYEVYVPNAFSPNDDGVNDWLQVYTGKDVSEVERFVVFNRWGGVMYEQKNCQPEDLGCGWDGYYQNNKAEPGIYVYMINVKFIDDEVKTFAGDFLLLQ